MFSGGTAEFEHSLFYATGCRYHNSARHPKSKISRLTHDSRSGGYTMSSKLINVGPPFLLQPLPYQWCRTMIYKCKRCIFIYMPLLSKENGKEETWKRLHFWDNLPFDKKISSRPRCCDWLWLFTHNYIINNKLTFNFTGLGRTCLPNR